MLERAVVDANLRQSRTDSLMSANKLQLKIVLRSTLAPVSTFLLGIVSGREIFASRTGSGNVKDSRSLVANSLLAIVPTIISEKNIAITELTAFATGFAKGLSRSSDSISSKTAEEGEHRE